MTNWTRLTGAGLLLLGLAMASGSRLLAAEDAAAQGASTITPEAYYFAQDAGRVGVATVASGDANSTSTAGAPAVAQAPAALSPTPEAKPRLSLGGSLGEGSECNGPCGEPGDYWFRGEYLHWWTKGSRIPSLVETGTAAAPFGPIAFGNSTVNGHDHEGFHITLGMWLDNCHTWGLEGDYFDLGRRANDYDSGLSNGNPVILRPFFNPDGTQNGESVAFPFGPAALAGRVTVDTDDYFQSAGVWLRRNWYCTECACPPSGDCESSIATRLGNNGGVRSTRVDAIIGYRHFRLNDRVAVHESLTDISGGPANGLTFDVQDSFRANNDFNGIDLGLDTRWCRDRWSLGLNAKVAFGETHQSVDIFGQTISTDTAGVVITDKGGLLALPTNMGLHSRNRFSAVPQLSTEVGFQMNCYTKLILGYDILYWDKVLRAGEQIDPIVDSGNIPPPPPPPGTTGHPEFHYREACYWAQGFRLGAEFRY